MPVVVKYNNRISVPIWQSECFFANLQSKPNWDQNHGTAQVGRGTDHLAQPFKKNRCLCALISPLHSLSSSEAQIKAVTTCWCCIWHSRHGFSHKHEAHPSEGEAVKDVSFFIWGHTFNFIPSMSPIAPYPLNFKHKWSRHALQYCLVKAVWLHSKEHEIHERSRIWVLSNECAYLGEKKF